MLGAKTCFAVHTTLLRVTVSLSRHTLPCVQMSSTQFHSSLLVHNNLPQSRSAGGAKMTPWPVWARVNRGPLILLKYIARFTITNGS